MKKIKVFLAAYINSTNAQNLNCRALAEHLDPDKFNVSAMKLYSGTLPIDAKLSKIKLFNVFYPSKLSKYIAHIQGILWADIIYLPNTENSQLYIFIIRLLKRKSFKTIEGIFQEQAISNAKKQFGSLKNMLYFLSKFDRVFSITKFMKDYNYKKVGIKSEDKILYLGSNTKYFTNEHKKISELSDVVFIGNDFIRKGIFDFLEIAEGFPQIRFHIVGTGNGRIDIKKEIENRSLSNIRFHGGLRHNELKKLLEEVQLHVLPSRSEGFPKVTLETAAAGVPSLVYDDYGAEEWITHNKNGFVVHTLAEMKETIKKLRENPKILQKTSQNAVQLAKRFDWESVVKEWEAVIEELYNEK